ncbi:glycoside hydrolase family 6 protein [Streptomyces fulvorobeus]|uniref:Glucanase n=1 Tax=Streptomyces fulvorobeus TaxID=284028 RepID=A0A7Y9HEH3_9ACTN|nr:glycoside hydrolase family 6 protein [Streptomyces fulvorobeus]NYE43040.1 endoglucanase [Streptomyces fulvorobeus]
MSGRRIFPVRTTVLTAVVLAATLSAGCASPPPGSGRQSSGTGAVRGEAAPSAAAPYWVDPDSDAARQVRAWEKRGRAEDAKVLKRIADRPVADWPAGDQPAAGIRAAVRSAAKSDQSVLLVAYNIPHRDCGAYSAGGAADAEFYRWWIGEFAGAIGGAPATVVLEPDAIPHIADGCTPPEHHEERYTLLAEAVDTLKKLSRTKVYLDAGNPEWIKDPSKLVEPLRRAGIERADGFALNVANFQTNATVTSYGARLSALTGGSHFVIDTSRNGNGPLSGDRAEAWCNPPGRALGTPPAALTGEDGLDAYLWIKRPGDSDGTCRGGPSAGTWWPEYALGLAERARS